jgi:hypothetical protein
MARIVSNPPTSPAFPGNSGGGAPAKQGKPPNYPDGTILVAKGVITPPQSAAPVTNLSVPQIPVVLGGPQQQQQLYLMEKGLRRPTDAATLTALVPLHREYDRLEVL